MSHSIYQWIQQGHIKPDQHQQALQLAGERASRADWLSFNKKMLLLLGVLALAFGVVFFFAFNWNSISRMVKFITLELLMVSFFVAYYFKSKSFWMAQALLLGAVIVMGALLALFGQTYQTGADPWQLFATWALLIVPWVLFSRSDVLWLVFAVLLNTALNLYLSVNHSWLGWSLSGDQWPWLFLLVNGVLLLLLEWFSSHSNTVPSQVKLNHRWAAQVVGLSVVFILTFIGMNAILGQSSIRAVNGLLYGLLMAVGYAYYRYSGKDLLLLTAWAFSLMVFVLTLLAHTIFDNFDAGGLLLMAISLIAMTAWSVKWIRQTHELFQSEDES